MSRKLITILFIAFSFSIANVCAIYAQEKHPDGTLFPYTDADVAEGGYNGYDVQGCTGNKVNGICETYCASPNANADYGCDDAIKPEFCVIDKGKTALINADACIDCGLCDVEDDLIFVDAKNPSAISDGLRSRRGVNLMTHDAPLMIPSSSPDCRIVTSDIDNNIEYFIPTATIAEWEKFQDAVNGGNVDYGDVNPFAPSSATCDGSLLDGVCVTLCPTCGDTICTVGLESCASCPDPLQGVDCPADCCPDPIYCGDDKKNCNEQCDGLDLGGTNCRTTPAGPLGNSTGGSGLACISDCTFDTSTCYYCGDGTCQAPSEGYADGFEECAPADAGDLCFSDCSVNDPMNGLVGGCCGDGICQIGEINCVGVGQDCGICGDGVIQANEQCEPDPDLLAIPQVPDLGGASCPSLGNLKDGTLGCNPVGSESINGVSTECMFDISQCEAEEEACVLDPNDAYAGFGYFSCPFGFHGGGFNTNYCDKNPVWGTDYSSFRFNWLVSSGGAYSCTINDYDCQFGLPPLDPSNPFRQDGPVAGSASGLGFNSQAWIMYGCYECTNQPANSTMCPGATNGLTGDTPATVINFGLCDWADANVPGPCHFYCDADYNPHPDFPGECKLSVCGDVDSSGAPICSFLEAFSGSCPQDCGAECLNIPEYALPCTGPPTVDTESAVVGLDQIDCPGIAECEYYCDTANPPVGFIFISLYGEAPNLHCVVHDLDILIQYGYGCDECPWGTDIWPGTRSGDPTVCAAPSGEWWDFENSADSTWGTHGLLSPCEDNTGPLYWSAIYPGVSAGSNVESDTECGEVYRVKRFGGNDDTFPQDSWFFPDDPAAFFSSRQVCPFEGEIITNGIGIVIDDGRCYKPPEYTTILDPVQYTMNIWQAKCYERDIDEFLPWTMQRKGVPGKWIGTSYAGTGDLLSLISFPVSDCQTSSIFPGEECDTGDEPCIYYWDHVNVDVLTILQCLADDMMFW